MRRTPMRRHRPDNHLSRDEWDTLTQLLLVRSGGYCEARTPACAAPGGLIIGMLRDQVSIQHRRAQGMGGTDLVEANELSNLLLFCGTGTTSCHGWVETQERQRAQDWGLWVPHDRRDGEPVPVEEYPLTLWSGRRVLLDRSSPTYIRHPDEWGGPDRSVA
jgi:hypothetical protein